jgi:hypothetical protein
MVIAVDKVLQGDGFISSSIVVEGDNGIQCRPYVTKYPIGSTQIFAISRTEMGGGIGYAISACGEYALQTTTP